MCQVISSNPKTLWFVTSQSSILMMGSYSFPSNTLDSFRYVRRGRNWPVIFSFSADITFTDVLLFLSIVSWICWLQATFEIVTLLVQQGSFGQFSIVISSDHLGLELKSRSLITVTMSSSIRSKISVLSVQLNYWDTKFVWIMQYFLNNRLKESNVLLLTQRYAYLWTIINIWSILVCYLANQVMCWWFLFRKVGEIELRISLWCSIVWSPYFIRRFEIQFKVPYFLTGLIFPIFLPVQSSLFSKRFNVPCVLCSWVLMFPISYVLYFSQWSLFSYQFSIPYFLMAMLNVERVSFVIPFVTLVLLQISMLHVSISRENEDLSKHGCLYRACRWQLILISGWTKTSSLC